MYLEAVAQGRSCCGWQSSCPCSSFFVRGSTLLLPREEGVCRVGELCLPDLAWILLSCSAPVPPAAPGCLSLSSVLSKGCLAKKLWAGKWCHHDNLFHTSLSQLSESVPLLGTWMTSLLRQGRWSHNSVPTVFDKVLSKVCRNSELLLWFKCSTIASVLQLLISMCLIQLCPPLLPWKAQWNLNFAKEGVHVSSSMREIVPAVVSILIATKASLEENISPSPLADNFIDLFLSHYVLYASVVCILYKASKVELLNKHPNVAPMCFHGWLHTDIFLKIFVYRTQCIIPPPNACTPPGEPESTSNAFCLADCSSVLTWGLFLLVWQNDISSSVIDICASQLRVWLRICMGLWIFLLIFQ